MKLFEEYLPRWSNEKHLPIPTQKHMDRWMVAWADFVKDELPKYYEQRRLEYQQVILSLPMKKANINSKILIFPLQEKVSSIQLLS